MSTKAALKEWLDTMIPEYAIKNFNQDWNDGRPLCALVDRLQPGLCPNHRSLNPNDGLENCIKGMKLAEDHFDIPAILDPEDMNNPEVDDLSIMTYLSYFFEPFMAQLLEWIKKKIPKNGITNLTTDWNTGVNLAALEEACHPGLFPSWEQLDPHKAKENLETCIKQANDRLDIKCPVNAATLSDPNVDDILMATYLSRFKYSKLSTSSDEVIVYPPKLKDGGYGVVSLPVEFIVELGSTPEATLSNLIFTAKSPNSEAIVTVKKPQKSDTTGSFIPQVGGKFILSCKFNNEEVSGCPIEVPVIDPSTWRILGDLPTSLQLNKPVTIQVQGDNTQGIKPVIACEAFVDPGDSSNQPDSRPPPNDSSPDGKNTSSGPATKGTDKTEPPKENSIVNGLDKPAVVGENFSFSVTPDTDGEIDVVIQGAAISYTPEIEKDDDDDEKYTVSFTPEEVGEHTVDISIGNTDVDGNPFTITVLQEKPPDDDDQEKPSSQTDIEAEDENEEDNTDEKQSNEGADGDNNEEAQVPERPREKAQFIQSSISPIDDNGKCNIYLLPTGKGKAITHVTVSGVDVIKSPFSLLVIDPSDYFMSSLDNETYLIEQEIPFTVNVKQSEVKPKVMLQGPDQKYTPAVIKVDDEEDNVYHYTFTPHKPGVVKISVQMEGGHIPGSPSTIQVSEPSIISEIPKFLEVGKFYSFDVLVESSLKQDPTVSTTNINGSNTEAAILEVSIFKNENHSNHWKLLLKPLDAGMATVDVKLGNFHVKRSPFSVKIAGISECSVIGLDKALLLAKPFSFNVIVGEGLTQKPEVMIYTPSSNAILNGIDNGNCSHTYTFTPIELGVIKVAILFGGKDIPGSPINKDVENPSDAKKCKAYGPALHPNAILQTGTPLEFCVDCRKNKGNGELQVVVQGPKKHDPKVLIAEEKGIYTLRIDAQNHGRYRVHVWWTQVHIPGSPFDFKVHQSSDPSKVKVYGPGIGEEIEVRKQADFYVLTKDAGMGTLTVIVYGVENAFQVNLKAEDPSEPRTLKGVYYPNEAGAYKVIVKWSGTHVPGSPFKVTVTDREYEIELARLEERRREKIKRAETQQRILRQQNLAIKKVVQAMPEFRKNGQLSMTQDDGQFGDVQESVIQKTSHRQTRHKMVRNASTSSAYETESHREINNDRRNRKYSAPSKTSMQQSGQSKSKKKLKSTQSFESAMQKNAEILGVHTSIESGGGSLMAGFTPLWHNSFLDEDTPPIIRKPINVIMPPISNSRIQPKSPRNSNLLADEDSEEELPDELPTLQTPMYGKSKEVPAGIDELPAGIDELPISITPIYDSGKVDVDDIIQHAAPVKGKKKNQRFNKKR